MLEPSDSQEAYDFVAEAFAVSEEFDTPVLLRSSTKLSHGRGQVVQRERIEPPRFEYVKDITKHLMVPQWARLRTRFVIQRLQRLRERAEESPLNVIEPGTVDFGIITSGVVYQYVQEAFPDVWVLKLGMSYPHPYRKIAELYEKVSRVAVVEELDPFIEETVRLLGLPVIGKEAIPADGELDQDMVFEALEALPRRRGAAAPKPGVPAGAASAAAAGRGGPARAAARALPRLPSPLGVHRAQASTSWRPWATSAATCSAPTRRSTPSTARCAWAPASA